MPGDKGMPVAWLLTVLFVVAGVVLTCC